MQNIINAKTARKAANDKNKYEPVLTHIEAKIIQQANLGLYEATFIPLPSKNVQNILKKLGYKLSINEKQNTYKVRWK